MNSPSAEFTFTGTLQFYIRHGHATLAQETGYAHVNLTGAQKIKYGSEVTCTCLLQEDKIALQFASTGNLPAGTINGLLYADGMITGKYELPDASVYTGITACFLSGSHGYTLSGEWPSGANYLYFEAALVVED